MPEISEDAFVDKVQGVWTRFNLSLKIPLMDLQHLWLTALIVELEEKLQTDSEDFHDVLTGVLDYTIDHFALEEALMREMGYPQSEGHTRQHQKFIASVRQRAREYSRGDAAVGAKLLSSLRQWLFSHILSEDRKYADFATTSRVDLNFLEERAHTQTKTVVRPEQKELYTRITDQEIRDDHIAEDIIQQVATIWNKYNLRIGIPIVDMQHLWLVQQVVELDKVIRSSSATRREKFQETVLGAVGYIKEHFSTEEVLMRQFHYKDQEHHIRQHKHFVEFVQERHQQSREEDMAAVSGLLHDLKEWLISHIAVEDKKLYYFFRSREREVAEFTKRQIRSGVFVIRKGYLDLYRHIVQYQV